tara:strand:+ start:1635 stop:2696 length:1062 start_codon:yes stop_codon:yes gene_type:complete
LNNNDLFIINLSQQIVGFLYIVLAITFVILLAINITWIVTNIVFWAFNGLQALLVDPSVIESIYLSTFLKWILLGDIIWIASALTFAFMRKDYRTDPKEHYLVKKPLDTQTMCVVLPAYNEELSIESVVKDFINFKNVKQVIVVDNNSSDKTIEIAEKAGAKVIKNKKNMGMAYSCVEGLRESLKIDVDVITLLESDGTCVSDDLNKMVPYLQNCDTVIGTRALQVLSEKGNQLGLLHVWGNYFLAKLIQVKFFSLLHMGVVSLTDVGCMYRIIRKDALEKIIDKFVDSKTGNVIPDLEFTLFMTMECLKGNLRIVEIPVTFKRRVGPSKTNSQKNSVAISVGFKYLWYILKS